MADFVGAEAYARVGYETEKGIFNTTNSNYIDFSSEAIAPGLTRVTNPSIRPRVGATRDRLSAAAPSGTLSMVVDPESAVRLIAHHLRKVTTTNPSGTAYQHVIEPLQPTDSTPATYRDTVWMELYRGDNRPNLMTNGRVGQRVITVGEDGGYVSEQFGFMFCRMGQLPEAVADGGNTGTFSGVVHVDGIPKDGLAANITLEFTTGGTLDGTAQMKVYTSAAGSTTYSVTEGEWIEINDESDAPLGPNYWNPLRVRFEGTGSPLTGDIWTITYTGRTVQTPSWTSRNDYHGAQVTATIGGTSYEIRGITLTVNQPLEMINARGGIWGDRIVNAGELEVSATISRKYTDTDFWDKALSDSNVALTITMEGDQITGTYRDKRLIEVAAMAVSGGGAQVSGTTTLDESITLVGYDNGTDPIIKETFINTIATI